MKTTTLEKANKLQKEILHLLDVLSKMQGEEVNKIWLQYGNEGYSIDVEFDSDLGRQLLYIIEQRYKERLERLEKEFTEL